MSAQASSLIRRYCPDFPVNHCGELFTDTSQFMRIGYGDVIVLDDLHYLVIRDEAERRFGLEDPKYWVKRCRVLETGERKILKLVFHETFPMKIGQMEVRCFRSPQKESRILNLVRGDMRFMQGFTVPDVKKNPVRVLDIIHGKRLDVLVEDMECGHEEYFFTHFPNILEKYIGACEAIAFLHGNYEKHGDIRRDHLFVEYDTKNYRWIDFDYTFDFHENPFGLDLFGLGNILVFLAGKGSHTVQSIPSLGLPAAALDAITPDDCSIMFGNRVYNLKKLFPYVPDGLNNALMRFSAGSSVYYDSVEELLAELRPVSEELSRGA